jgi:hypothetical protein
VTEFDLRAIGWVVTRETVVDIVRGAFGAPRRVEPSVLAALAEQWSALENLRREERAASPLARRRCRMGLAQAGTGYLGGIVLSCAGFAPDTLLADAAPVLLAMGLWYSLTTVQLWRSYQLVNGLASRAQRSRPQMISQTPGGRDNARRPVSNRRV